MKLVIGLGNPGNDYKHTRHNIGFMALDTFISENGLSESGHKFKSQVFKGTVANETIIGIKPETFMNLSGEAVQAFAQFYKVPINNILVTYDDFELDYGQIRIRKKGSAGTHNGMKSIIQLLNSTDCPRMRLGIGPKPELYETKDFVLSNFTDKEMVEIALITKNASDAIVSWIEDGIDRCMNKYNGQ
ncbi:aminoacyl-tRNA hydrolase [bacterium]|jgi:peptidyl-tRNA hydrolase, PTH1 family|nr:aminoacyl-tRNA hydrolase [bacterium]